VGQAQSLYLPKALHVCWLVLPSGQGQVTTVPSAQLTGRGPSLFLFAFTVALQPERAIATSKTHECAFMPGDSRMIGPERKVRMQVLSTRFGTAKIASEEPMQFASRAIARSGSDAIRDLRIAV
jgi:hypothetical protein